MSTRFRDRVDAGRQLARALEPFRTYDPVVLGLPRGGVPVAWEVARHLGAPLDVMLVRKLGVPGQEELAFGAVASGHVRVLNEQVVRAMRLLDPMVAAVTTRELEELRRRERLFLGDRAPLDLHGRAVIVVDDGLATGATMRAALQAVRKRGARRVIAAVPVGAPDACDAVGRDADEVVCLQSPESFSAVGFWYDDFRPTSDDEVRDLLARAHAAQGEVPHAPV